MTRHSRWNRPSATMFAFMFAASVSGYQPDSMWCHSSSWCSTIPSTKPPTPSPVTRPAHGNRARMPPTTPPARNQPRMSNIDTRSGVGRDRLLGGGVRGEEPGEPDQAEGPGELGRDRDQGDVRVRRLGHVVRRDERGDTAGVAEG